VKEQKQLSPGNFEIDPELKSELKSEHKQKAQNCKGS